MFWKQGKKIRKTFSVLNSKARCHITGFAIEVTVVIRCEEYRIAS